MKIVVEAFFWFTLYAHQKYIFRFHNKSIRGFKFMMMGWGGREGVIQRLNEGLNI